MVDFGNVMVVVCDDVHNHWATGHVTVTGSCSMIVHSNAHCQILCLLCHQNQTGLPSISRICWEVWVRGYTLSNIYAFFLFVFFHFQLFRFSFLLSVLVFCFIHFHLPGWQFLKSHGTPPSEESGNCGHQSQAHHLLHMRDSKAGCWHKWWSDHECKQLWFMRTRTIANLLSPISRLRNTHQEAHRSILHSRPQLVIAERLCRTDGSRRHILLYPIVWPVYLQACTWLRKQSKSVNPTGAAHVPAATLICWSQLPDFSPARKEQ